MAIDSSKLNGQGLAQIFFASHHPFERIFNNNKKKLKYCIA
jgi:hypothetical protein